MSVRVVCNLFTPLSAISPYGIKLSLRHRKKLHVKGKEYSMTLTCLQSEFYSMVRVNEKQSH